MKRITGGFMCAMKNCKKNSQIHRNLSFFRFPSNSERAKMWLQACGIKKDILPDKLYKNYRVCSKHFSPYMFLNDLKNRLQPHAIPNASYNINNENESTVQTEINIETVAENDANYAEVDAQSVVAMCSTSSLIDIDESTFIIEDINLPSNDDQYLQIPTNDKCTQTESKLSNCTPRKITLRRKCDAAEKRARRAILKTKEEEKNLETITFCDFQKLLYKFYPKTIADFMIAQRHNLQENKIRIFLEPS